MTTFYIYPNIKDVETPGPSTVKTLDMPKPLVVEGMTLGNALGEYINREMFKRNTQIVDLSNLNLSFPDGFFDRANKEYIDRVMTYSLEGLWTDKSKILRMNNCDMKNVWFKGGWLRNIDFSGSDFSGACGRGATFDSCIFSRCNFFKADLKETKWYNSVVEQVTGLFSDLRDSIWKFDLNAACNINVQSWLSRYDGSYNSIWFGSKVKGMQVDKKHYPTLYTYNYFWPYGFVKRINLYDQLWLK